MGAEGGCTEANIMVYLGVVEQRANELLLAADRVLQQDNNKNEHNNSSKNCV